MAKSSDLAQTEDGEGCAVAVVEFDFEQKVDRGIALAEASAAMDAGRFVWIDVRVDRTEGAARLLDDLGLLEPEVIEAALHHDPGTQHARYEQCLHLVVSGCRQRGPDFDLQRVDVVIAERFLITIHRGSVEFLSAVRRDYRSDFLRFARSPSFLLYELWDHLLENYLSVQKAMEERVEQLQNELRTENEIGRAHV